MLAELRFSNYSLNCGLATIRWTSDLKSFAELLLSNHSLNFFSATIR
jgi:hypothetical protein